MTLSHSFFSAVLLLGATFSAACNGNGDSGDPASRSYLQFTRIEGGEETLLGVSLDGCYEDKTGCYSVSNIGTDAEGTSNRGELSEAQLNSVKALLTSDLLGHYDEDEDPQCAPEPALRFVLSYDNEAAVSTMWCFDAEDDLSSETRNTLDELTGLSELLLQE